MTSIDDTPDPFAPFDAQQEQIADLQRQINKMREQLSLVVQVTTLLTRHVNNQLDIAIGGDSPATENGKGVQE